MADGLDKADREQALDSLQRWCEANLDEAPGRLQCGALLDFFLEEIGPLAYNRGVADAQARLLQRVGELDFEVHQDEFPYWRRSPPARR